MIKFLRKLFGFPEIVLGVARSPLWEKTRKVFLQFNPNCAVCGSNKDVVPHHIKPFHLYPEFELDLDNLISLCERPKVLNCHLIFGHHGNFKKFNPDVVVESSIWKKKLR